MSYSYGFGSFYSQPTMDELRAKAKASVSQLSKKGQKLDPIELMGKKISTTWWGNAWCDNLERYADFANRIDRGKRYVRAGCVIDLKIEPGLIKALVQGSRKNPYKVEVSIKPMDQKLYTQIIEGCTARAKSLEALALGDFPQELKEHLFDKKGGIFPSPKEIKLGCSCPDAANLCKHIAAAMYAVGSRLDTQPLLHFTLRGIDTESLIKRTVEQKLASMLANADTKSPRILDANDRDLTRLFGVL